MQVARPMGYPVSELLDEPIPEQETLYVSAPPSQAVSLGGGRYVYERLTAIYRDPQRTYDAVCLIVTPVGSGMPRVERVTFYARDGGDLDGDLRIPLATIRDTAIDVYGIGKGPDLPPGSPHPDGMRVVFEPGWTGETDQRPYHTVDERRLAEVAWVVGRAAREGRSTRQAIKDVWKVELTTAAEWIMKARKDRMLPQVDGKRNPSVEDNQPTDRALQTLGIEPREDEP